MADRRRFLMNGPVERDESRNGHGPVLAPVSDTFGRSVPNFPLAPPANHLIAVLTCSGSLLLDADSCLGSRG
jgi:hypothetical protein